MGGRRGHFQSHILPMTFVYCWQLTMKNMQTCHNLPNNRRRSRKLHSINCDHDGCVYESYKSQWEIRPSVSKECRKVSYALPFTTNVTISTSISQTFLSSNIRSSPAYGVFISQLIRYARACSSYECFILRATRLSS